MGNAFSTGWRIARARRSEFLDPTRRGSDAGPS